jgi:hypothetical protein
VDLIVPNYTTRTVRVRAEKNRSEFPVQVRPVGGGPAVTVDPGDWVVTHPNGRVEGVNAAYFEAVYEADSENAEREAKAQVQYSRTGVSTEVPEGARVPFGSEDPVEGMVSYEEPYEAPADGTQNPQQIESAVWRSLPTEAFEGQDYTAEDRPQGSEAAHQLGHEDKPDTSEPNDVEQAQEAHDQLVAVGEAREGATVEARSDESGQALNTDPGENVAPDVNETAVDDPEDVAANAAPDNSEPRRPADDLPS